MSSREGGAPPLLFTLLFARSSWAALCFFIARIIRRIGTKPKRLVRRNHLSPAEAGFENGLRSQGSTTPNPGLRSETLSAFSLAALPPHSAVRLCLTVSLPLK